MVKLFLFLMTFRGLFCDSFSPMKFNICTPGERAGQAQQEAPQRVVRVQHARRRDADSHCGADRHRVGQEQSAPTRDDAA